ncbi:MAG: ergothioneine biosynthesis protein EgtB [Thermodesulfobacteriota bacterium]
MNEGAPQKDFLPTSNLGRDSLASKYREVRKFSETLCQPLNIEDYVIQSMPDVSPTKWHLAHTSWFFETFVLPKADPKYKSPNPQYAYLFNSYYVLAGERWYRPNRGLISRPGVEDTFKYRKHVDNHMLEFLENSGEVIFEELAPIIEIGLHHEQQHQELMLTDIKHVFSINPMKPAYRKDLPTPPKTKSVEKMGWVEFPEGQRWIGSDGESFAYDNELPLHRQFVGEFSIATRLVTNGEYVEFIEDGAYERPELWLSDGWATIELNDWKAPLYWEKLEGKWRHYTLAGMRGVNPEEPVSHLSFYEAEAYAGWAGARLPTEAEWETASSSIEISGNFADDGYYHPIPTQNGRASGSIQQMFGDLWEWTRSSYSPYPGYSAPSSALGEYNGKFMSNQMVLRGGSCATPKSHIRPTYRNFFPPEARWQFKGLRLAK